LRSGIRVSISKYRSQRCFSYRQHLSIIARRSQARQAGAGPVGWFQKRGLVLGGAENVAERLDKGIFELLLTLIGFAFQLRAQGLAPSLDSTPVIYSVVTNSTAGYLGISNRQTIVGNLHSVGSSVGVIFAHRFSYFKQQ
jgi:hypothetical protein